MTDCELFAYYYPKNPQIFLLSHHQNCCTTQKLPFNIFLGKKYKL